MSFYSSYANFCSSAGYHVYETEHGVWIGRPKRGFSVRLPFYETARPAERELRTIFKQMKVVGVNYSSSDDCNGTISQNYFVRDRNYDLNMLPKKGRWSVRRGLELCKVREIDFDELYRYGMPLNMDSHIRHQRYDHIFNDERNWKKLCQAGADIDEIEAWGAFVGKRLGSYIITIRLGRIVSLLFNTSCIDLLSCHCASALFYTVTKHMMSDPCVEAVYNGSKWLNMPEGLDRFKKRMGFSAEPVTYVLCLRPLAERFLLNNRVRRTFSAIGPKILNYELCERIEVVLGMAEASKPH